MIIERPILFSAPMVRAVLDGSKTQTRRIMKHAGTGAPPPETVIGGVAKYATGMTVCCPYGRPGDRLWVRETFAAILPQDPTYNGGAPIAYDYAATYKHGDRLGDSLGVKKRWTPSIHMPRAASRIQLEIVSVRAERLNDCSEADARAEGCAASGWAASYSNPDNAGCDESASAADAFTELWESINGAGSWAANPWVWVIEFKRVTQ